MPHSSKLCLSDTSVIEHCSFHRTEDNSSHTCSSKNQTNNPPTITPTEPGAIRSWLMLLIWIKCLMDSEPCASFSKRCIIISFILWRKASQRRAEIWLDTRLPMYVFLEVTRLTIKTSHYWIQTVSLFFFFGCLVSALTGRQMGHPGDDSFAFSLWFIFVWWKTPLANSLKAPSWWLLVNSSL